MFTDLYLFCCLLLLFRYTVKELTEFEKDLLLLGIISTSINDSTPTSGKKRRGSIPG